MGFTVHTTDDGRNLPIEYLPAGTVTPKIGMALRLTGGKLAAASGAEVPSYIAMTEREKPCEDGEIIPVVRVGADVVWRTTAAVALTGVSLGNKVTLSADGMAVTATKGGAAEITGMDGTEAGSRVTVRFGGVCEACESCGAAPDEDEEGV